MPSSQPARSVPTQMKRAHSAVWASHTKSYRSRRLDPLQLRYAALRSGTAAPTEHSDPSLRPLALPPRAASVCSAAAPHECTCLMWVVARARTACDTHPAWFQVDSRVAIQFQAPVASRSCRRVKSVKAELLENRWRCDRPVAVPICLEREAWCCRWCCRWAGCRGVRGACTYASSTDTLLLRLRALRLLFLLLPAGYGADESKVTR